MRTLKLQTQVTVDGFMSGPASEMDWVVKATPFACGIVPMNYRPVRP